MFGCPELGSGRVFHFAAEAVESGLPVAAQSRIVMRSVIKCPGPVSVIQEVCPRGGATAFAPEPGKRSQVDAFVFRQTGDSIDQAPIGRRVEVGVLIFRREDPDPAGSAWDGIDNGVHCAAEGPRRRRSVPARWIPV